MHSEDEIEEMAFYMWIASCKAPAKDPICRPKDRIDGRSTAYSIYHICFSAISTCGAVFIR